MPVLDPAALAVGRPPTALVAEHLGLVRALARQLVRSGTARYLEIDELVSLGTIALLEAARRFDPRAGTRFTTFAYPRIRGAMIDGIADLAPLKRSAYRTARRHAADGRAGVAIASLEAMLERGHEIACEPVDAPDAVDRARRRRAVARALGALPERKRRFVEDHYGAGRDLKDIGAELGLSKSWASRLLAQALAELRRAVSEAVASDASAQR